MIIDCPYCCGEKLLNLDDVMVEMSQLNRMSGEMEFETACCGKGMKVFSNAGKYSVAPTDELPAGKEAKREFIGAD